MTDSSSLPVRDLRQITVRPILHEEDSRWNALMRKHHYLGSRSLVGGNDPNLWCKEHVDQLYIFNLVLRIVRVRMETVKIVIGLPSLETEDMRGYRASYFGGEAIAAEED